jgi:large subunit ribosomal protein L21
MYAVVETGGKQIRVTDGDTVEIERLPGAPGDQVTFDRVLCLSGDGRLVAGNPTVEGAVVIGLIEAQVQGRKIDVFRYKSKVNFRRKTGHRQQRTRVRIVKIFEDATQVPAADAFEEPAEEPAAQAVREPAAEAVGTESAAPEA